MNRDEFDPKHLDRFISSGEEPRDDGTYFARRREELHRRGVRQALVVVGLIVLIGVFCLFIANPEPYRGRWSSPPPSHPLHYVEPVPVIPEVAPAPPWPPATSKSPVAPSPTGSQPTH